ncbi:hypothetical protein G7Y89_g12073 [Cudoniella acicularis]|uniref:BTB domain-containing protein n=1 Tax=Cudoniella acicularis TaxID=354080 RepID=A0A8H4RBX8_9HELO|nr:hypothetical protein G7Y89_g12073 [Cudoniella acicularis]
MPLSSPLRTYSRRGKMLGPTSSSVSSSPSRSSPRKPVSQNPIFSHPEQLVTFLIGKGENAKPFPLHKDFVCVHSPVFNRAFNGRWVEATTHTYKLEETTLETFHLYALWLYTKTLDGHGALVETDSAELEELEDLPEDVATQFRENQLRLIELWCFADKYAMPKLQNVAMTHFARILNADPLMREEVIEYVYSTTAPGSQMQKYVMEAATISATKFAKEGDAEMIGGVTALVKSFPVDLIPQFVAALAIKITRAQGPVKIREYFVEE